MTKVEHPLRLTQRIAELEKAINKAVELIPGSMGGHVTLGLNVLQKALRKELPANDLQTQCKTCEGVGSYYLTPEDRSTRCMECPICHGTGVEPILEPSGEEGAFMSAEEFWLSAYKYWPELPQTAEQIFKFAEAYAQYVTRSHDWPHH